MSYKKRSWVFGCLKTFFFYIKIDNFTAFPFSFCLLQLISYKRYLGVYTHSMETKEITINFFDGDHLSIPKCTGSCGYFFHEIPSTRTERDQSARDVNPKKSTVNFFLPPSGDDNEPIQRRSKPKNVVPVDIIKLVQGYDYEL